MDHELERRVQELRRRHPDVHVYPVATHHDIARSLEANHERVQLVVIGGSKPVNWRESSGRTGIPCIGTPNPRSS